MIKITQEPEFVFYHNPLKGVVDSGYIPGGSCSSDDVTRCFRRLASEEIEALQIDQIIYVDREIYDDSRVFDASELFSDNYGIVAGLMRVRVIRGSNSGFEYATLGNCNVLIRPGITKGIYDSPDLDKINELIACFGEGIVIPPIMKDYEAL